MPTVVNGIGTWYYGKRHIHRRKDVCQFCNLVGELESYDTTLYVVFVFVPILPLAHKRILEQCPSCGKHRVLPLKKWEALKAQDIAQMLERLQANPDDRDTILGALALAMGYQDETLFDKLAGSLAEHRRDDAAIQAQLGAGYAYFARYDEAEAAYRASLAVADDPAVRHNLALSFLKQLRPDFARPLLRHILDDRVRDDVGMIYLLVEAYQAQGMHPEALEVMDQRDAAFPDLANLKDYQKQRKTSRRYLNSGKKVKPALLGESGRAGYREGGWTSRIPRLIPLLLVAGLLTWYLGAAVWKGQSRQVFVVNGWDRPYTVAINGKEQQLQPGRPAEVSVPEGEVVVEFPNPPAALEPVRCRVETPFFSRPFRGYTFVLNPDRLAVLVREETIYSENPQPVQEPVQVHLGKVLHEFRGLDYEFTPFPASLPAKKGSVIRKTRVGLAEIRTAEDRLAWLHNEPDAEAQLDYVRRWLQLSPNDVYFLSWLAGRLPEDEALAFLRAGLPVRPPRVEWHRVYQSLMDRSHPDQDLRPEYRRLVEETKGHPDAVYLLARVEDLDAGDKLYRQAAEANPPSAHALHALGYRALAEGRFPEAVQWMDRAVQRAPGHPGIRQTYQSALLAAGAYDRLLKEAPPQPAGMPNFSALAERIRIHAAQGDRAQARVAITQAVQGLAGVGNAQVRQMVQAGLEIVWCSAANDVPNFLKWAAQVPGFPRFEPALLEGKLVEAAGAVERQDNNQALVQHGLVWLAARKAGNRQLADEQWQQLLLALGKGDRYERRLGVLLAGPAPPNADLLRRFPIDPKQKRVLLAVAARRYPEQAKELLPLARKLDFSRDGTSLCLRRVLD